MEVKDSSENTLVDRAKVLGFEIGDEILAKDAATRHDRGRGSIERFKEKNGQISAYWWNGDSPLSNLINLTKKENTSENEDRKH